MPGRLEGKVAIVTGAARGTGEATARRFVAEGARVVLGDVLDERGEDVARSLGDAGVYRHHDVRSEADWDRCVALAQERFGRVDVLVNNAAVLHIAPLEQTALADWQRLVDVNQTGVFLGIRTVAPVMRAGGGGSIVNVSSIDGLEGMDYVSAYSATKWALRGLTKCAAIELGRDGIRVNTVCPAGGSDEMAAAWRRPGSDDGAGYDQKRPIPRRATVEEIAGLILYLASDEASFCTGGDYPIDGGHSCGSRLGGMPRRGNRA
ncbi:MAG: glucose 1-dehydrogenase [Spirochaetaceae bacterium]|nr:glucose 1-dehydrogenase [Myxococcales bacterium]MCB9725161.1 glucose 1-dehydrogenase [Spirochaetaceae bacterium]HPG27253.1 glucose 1-dehydrogenase [Myxococcota bacterium]